MRYVPTRRGLHAAALGGAWFFIVASLLALAWVVAVKVDDPAAPAALYQTATDTGTIRAWGLVYDGVGGLIRSGLQAAIVIGAAVLTLVPWIGRRPRRLAHGVLLGWALWWTGNVLWLASADGQLSTALQGTLLAALAGCTGYRAWRGWTPRPRVTVEIRPAAGPPPAVPPGPAPPLRARLAGWWTPQRRAALGGATKRAGAAIGRGAAATARATRDGARRGIAALQRRGLPATGR